MLPSLARLSVTPTGTELVDLPPELLAIIGSLVDSDDPCRDLEDKCRLNKQWLALCRDGSLYEAANLRLGFYGTFPSLDAVRQHYEAHPGPWCPPPTAKWYFRAACQAMAAAGGGLGSVPGSRHIDTFHPSVTRIHRYEDSDWSPPSTGSQMDNDEEEGEEEEEETGPPANTPDWVQPRPWYSALAKRVAAVLPENAMAYVPPYLPDWLEIARIALTSPNARWQGAIRFVNTKNRAYVELATLAVQHDPSALRYIKPSNEAYVEIAKLSVQHFPNSLAEVPHTTPDYDEIFKIAARQSPRALDYWASGWSRFREDSEPMRDELVKFALQQHAKALKCLMYGSVWERVRHGQTSDLLSYAEYAKFAVQHDPRAVEYMASADDDHVWGVKTWQGEKTRYVEIAKLALQQDPLLIKKLQQVRNNLESSEFLELAKFAVQQDPSALRRIDNYDPTYDEIAKAAIRRDPSVIRYVNVRSSRQGWNYMHLARLAVQQDPEALQFVDRTTMSSAAYAQLLQAARAHTEDIEALRNLLVPP